MTNTQCQDQFAGYTCRLPAGHDGEHRGSLPTVQPAKEAPHHHRIAWTIDRFGVVTSVLTCTATKGGACRLTCRQGCEEYATDGSHEHQLVDYGCCTAAGWINEGHPDEVYDGGPDDEPVRDGPVHVQWDGDGWVWRYADVPHLSRDELIRIAAAAIHDAGGDRPVTTGTAVVHALHQLGALPIGGPSE